MSVETDPWSAAAGLERIAITGDALVILLAAGVNPREVAGRLDKAESDLLALGLSLFAGYRLSDGEKVWLIGSRDR